jgi:hypothetical protein
MVIEAPPNQLDILLDRYEEKDRSAAKDLLELRATTDPKLFTVQVCQILLKRPASGAFRYLASLLEFEDIARFLLDVYRDSKEDAFSIAEKLQSTDPRFDTQLLKRYSDRDMVNWSDDELLAALEILDAVSERDRLVLGVSKFLRHPHSNIRSRAAKFLARRRPTLGLIADLARESDPVVRTGLIEGLYDRREEFVPAIFREHVRDQYSGVSASAVFGLYLAGDPKAIGMIDEMARHTRSEFREAAAAVMARTGDPRFSANLAALLSDGDEAVRRRALRGLGEIKKSLAAARSQDALRIRVLKHSVREGKRSLWVSISENSGTAVRDLLATRFLLKSGGVYVREYGVEEYDANTGLNLSLILCEPPKGEFSLRTEFEEAAEAFSELRRSRDSVSAMRLSHEIHLRCYATDSSSSDGILTRALAEIDFSEPRQNLVLIGATSYTKALERLLAIAAKCGAAVHVIAVAAEWRSPELVRQVEDAGGFFRTAEPGEIAQTSFELYSALLHRYRIYWANSAGSVEVEVRSESGSGVTTYE